MLIVRSVFLSLALLFAGSISSAQSPVPDWPTAPVADNGLAQSKLDALAAAIRAGEFKKIGDRKSTRLNSSHLRLSRMPSSA